MGQRDAVAIYDRSTQPVEIYVRRDKLELQPGIFKRFVVVNLIQSDFIEICAAVIVAHNGACPPWRLTGAIFILQANEQQNILQTLYWSDDLYNKFDGT